MLKFRSLFICSCPPTKKNLGPQVAPTTFRSLETPLILLIFDTPHKNLEKDKFILKFNSHTSGLYKDLSFPNANNFHKNKPQNN